MKTRVCSLDVNTTPAGTYWHSPSWFPSQGRDFSGSARISPRRATRTVKRWLRKEPFDLRTDVGHHCAASLEFQPALSLISLLLSARAKRVLFTNHNLADSGHKIVDARAEFRGNVWGSRSDGPVALSSGKLSFTDPSVADLPNRQRLKDVDHQ